MAGRGNRLAAALALALTGSLLAGCPGPAGPPIRAEVTPPIGYRIVAMTDTPEGDAWLLLAALEFLGDTRPAAAVMHVDAADMTTRGPRLRRTQTQAGLAHPDATAGPLAQGRGYGVGKLTGTGLYVPRPIQAVPNPPGAPRAAEILLVIVVRGPLVEVASIAVDATDIRLFADGTRFATAMVTALCRYDIGCS